MVLLGACAGEADTGRGDRAGKDPEGPLRTTAGAGGFALEAPARPGRGGTWRGTFGGFVLCSSEGSEPITLTEVRLRESVEPASTRVFVRDFDPEEVAGLPRGQRSSYLSFQGTLGSPPNYVESYAGAAVPGHYVTDLEEVEVTQTCAQATRTERDLTSGRPPAEAFLELVVSMTSGPGGAQLDGLDVDYRVGDDDYTLFVDWTLIACGPDVTIPQAC